MRVRGCTPSPFCSIYHHEQSCGIRSSWEGRYASPVSLLPLKVLTNEKRCRLKVMSIDRSRFNLFMPRVLSKSFFFKYFFGGFFLFCRSYYIQHCFICRLSDSAVPTDAGIEPRTVATGALAVRRSKLKSVQASSCEMPKSAQPKSS